MFLMVYSGARGKLIHEKNSYSILTLTLVIKKKKNNVRKQRLSREVHLGLQIYVHRGKGQNLKKIISSLKVKDNPKRHSLTAAYLYGLTIWNILYVVCW